MRMRRKTLALVFISLTAGLIACGPAAVEETNTQRQDVRAEIVAIGDELCYGKVYDTNSFWIADQITRRGAFVQRIVCVRDNLDDISSALNEAIGRRPRFLFITGGLGPTDDDLTRAALSKVTGRKIVERPDLLERIADQRNVPVESLPPVFLKSTSSLEGATSLPNPAGTAPVILIDQDGVQIIAMPGPPREVHACFEAHLAEMVQEATQYYSTAQRVQIQMHESELAPLMTKVTEDNPGVYVKAVVGDYDNDRGMPVEIMAFGPSQDECLEICDNAKEELRQLAAEKNKDMVEIPEEN